MIAVVFGSVAAQRDSANPTDPSITAGDAPAYIYLDYETPRSADGLLSQYMNPVTRSSVTDFFIAEIGDEEIASALLHAAEKHGIDPALVVAVSWQESGFRTDAVGVNKNRTKDRGLMQLNSATFSYLGEKEFFDPRINADLGVSYLKETLESSGNVVAALAMYNAGPGRVGRLGAPRSTLDYISKIMTRRAELIKGYGDRYGANGILMSREIRPLKNPNLL